MSLVTLSKLPVHPTRGYAIAALVLGLATLVRAALDPALGDRLPYATYIPAVAIVGWVGGLGPALLSMVGGSYIAHFLYLTPRYQPFPYDASNSGLFGTLAYGLATGSMILLTQAMHRAYQRADRDGLALKVAEARLRLFIENAPAAIAMFDRDMRYLAVSRRFMNDYGLAGDVLGKSYYDLLPEVPQRWIDAHRRGLAGEVLTADEDPFPRADGSVQYVKWEIRPWQDSGGAVGGILIAAEDISSRVRTDAESRERARLLDLSNDTIFTRDMHNRITYWNQGAADTYGYTSEEALGRVTHELLKTEFPEPLENINDVLLREGRWSGELVHTTRDGRTIVDASRWALERDASGQPSAILETNLDITARKQTERLVRENEERLRLAQAVSRIGSFDWNIQTNINIWSPELEAMYGLEPGQFGGTQTAWEKLVHPEDLAAITAKVDETFQHGEPVEGEWRIVRPDGSIRWLAGRFQCIKDDRGRPQRLVGVNIDVTERKSAEQQRADAERRLKGALAEADRASRLKDEFLATLSHELRTPMNAIVGWTSMLASGVKKDDIQHGLKVIERNARLQSQIIEDLLDMSRIITGKVRLNLQSVDLAKVVTEALEAVRPAADAKGVRVESICDPRATDVRGDPDRLQQVLYNLLSNAVKFTPRDGKVQVHCQRVNSHVEIGVADTGVGIKPEFLPHVFERFRQQDATTVREFSGLGLGLAIVKHIVELHGGRVHVASQGEGRGATFTLHLPIALALRPPFTPDESTIRQHPAVARVAANDAAGVTFVDVSSALDGLRVLVVEDDADARDLLRTMLMKHGAQVVLAASGEEALDRLRPDRPDVLVCDIGMPRMDGYEVIAAVRKLRASDGGSTAAIALTAFARSEDRVRALQAGFDMHLSKPIETLELVMSIKAATRLRPAERA